MTLYRSPQYITKPSSIVHMDLPSKCVELINNHSTRVRDMRTTNELWPIDEKNEDLHRYNARNYELTKWATYWKGRDIAFSLWNMHFAYDLDRNSHWFLVGSITIIFLILRRIYYREQKMGTHTLSLTDTTRCYLRFLFSKWLYNQWIGRDWPASTALRRLLISNFFCQIKKFHWGTHAKSISYDAYTYTT